MKLKGESQEGKAEVKGDLRAMRNKEDDRLPLSGVYRVSGGCRALQRAIRLALRWLDKDEDISTSGTRHARAVTNQRRVWWRDRIRWRSNLQTGLVSCSGIARISQGIAFVAVLQRADRARPRRGRKVVEETRALMLLLVMMEPWP
jgi:hypothetical protein